jgi:predicted RNase H-like HicB family nuclease
MMTKVRKRSVRRAEHRYTVILEPGEGGYIASCPALPGCHTEGDTFEEAMKNIREAVEVYCESLVQDGEPLPVENYIFTTVAFRCDPESVE